MNNDIVLRLENCVFTMELKMAGVHLYTGIMCLRYSSGTSKMVEYEDDISR